MRSLVTTVVGNVAKDVSYLSKEAGKESVTFRIAVDNSYFDGVTWQERPAQFLSVYARRELAKNAAESLKKGERVIVSGRLSGVQWQDERGGEHFTLALYADALGHDLRFGTSSYLRREKVVQLPPPEAVASAFACESEGDKSGGEAELESGKEAQFSGAAAGDAPF
ncbi:single-stranded DNA-binding protein [Dermabacteraceae bacterium TAE3-ERU27]|nr:single-stranded DNA-binding protein [Dermabacteraceae bacterium TAE3-ERU27]